MKYADIKFDAVDLIQLTSALVTEEGRLNSMKDRYADRPDVLASADRCLIINESLRVKLMTALGEIK